MPGDSADIFGNLTQVVTGWCKPLGSYDFLSEGDGVVAYFPPLTIWIQDPTNPNLRSWGGRAVHITSSPNLWTMVAKEKDSSGNEIDNYTTYRWTEAAVALRGGASL